jgi:hypothetical protein
MEFAGKEYIYLSKLKKDKIKKLKNSEEDNKEEAPQIKEEPEKEDEKDEMEEVEKHESISQKLEKYSSQKPKRKNSDLSDDACLSVCSAGFDKDLEDNDDDENISVDEDAPPIPEKKGQIFRKEIDTNICQIRYDKLEKLSDNLVLKTYKCKKCQAYLNKHSNLMESKEKGKMDWKCEFCSEMNEGLAINKKDIPINDDVDNCLEPPLEIEKKTADDNDSSLIFCFDISGSMCQSYDVGKELKDKFNKIRGIKSKKRNIFNDDYDDDDIDFTNFDFNQDNTSYLSRLDLVKLSIEENINSLLKKSPNVKVGIVSFGSQIEVKGDCLSNIMIIKEKDMNNESKIKSIGEENTNLVKAPIKNSSKKILESLLATEENGSTALGPAVSLSLSLLKNAKIGSRIFLCTDGMSNLGVGDISADREEAKKFYSKIGDEAKQKGIVINLITFEDSESEIEVLMSMVQKSGGEIIRVNPHEILDGFNDLLENEAIASEVEVRMNLNRCMTFRDQKENDMTNDGSTIVKKIGNVTKETETYYELKFKKAIKLSEMKDINFDELKNLVFQCEIIYKKKDGGKYVRIISRNMKVSDNKEEIEKQANFEIVSTMEIQKSAKLASEGLFREAQAQAHITRKYLAMNSTKNQNSKETYHLFNNNMNSFNNNMGNLHRELRSVPMSMFENKNNYNNNIFNDNNNNNNLNSYNRSDFINEQIFSLSNTSNNRQKNEL